MVPLLVRFVGVDRTPGEVVIGLVPYNPPFSLRIAAHDSASFSRLGGTTSTSRSSLEQLASIVVVTSSLSVDT
jgi:hypothetical protein